MIETWWLNYTFTLNWKLVEPGTISFARGESLGQLLPVPHATFEDATAVEAPIGLLEPEAAQDLLKWQETRRPIAGQKDNVHHLYRKADGIEEHFSESMCPPFARSFRESTRRMQSVLARRFLQRNAQRTIITFSEDSLIRTAPDLHLWRRHRYHPR